MSEAYSGGGARGPEEKPPPPPKRINNEVIQRPAPIPPGRKYFCLRSMVFILGGNSEHNAHAHEGIRPFGWKKKAELWRFPIKSNALKKSHSWNGSLRAHPSLSYHLKYHDYAPAEERAESWQKGDTQPFREWFQDPQKNIHNKEC